MLGVHKEGQERFSKIQAICNKEKKKKRRKLRSALVLNYIRAVPWLGCVPLLKRPQTLGSANPLLLPLSAGKGQILNRAGLLKSILKQRN